MKADMELRDLILDIFQVKGDVTIAGMVRELESRGVNHHRLTVTGYLHALADTGYLEVRSVPPAKLFTLKTAPKRSLYTVVGDCSRRVSSSDKGAVELTVGTLEHILDRPVFLSEITEAGFSRIGNLHQLGKKERSEALKRLEQCGVSIREGEPLFRAREQSQEGMDRLMGEALLEAMDAQGERPREIKQTSLTLEQFG